MHAFCTEKKDDKMALGEHYRDCHAKVEKPSITFQIIKHQPDLLRLHIEEAIAIQKFNSALNRRRETLGTGFLPKVHAAATPNHLNLNSHQILQCTHTSPALTFLAICPVVFL